MAKKLVPSEVSHADHMNRKIPYIASRGYLARNLHRVGEITLCKSVGCPDTIYEGVLLDLRYNNISVVVHNSYKNII